MNTGPRILLVEPDKVQATLIRRAILERLIDALVTIVGDSATALTEIRGRRHDVAVIEFELENSDGLKLLELIRQSDVDLPVIMLSAVHSEQLASEAVNFGASDFVVKENSYRLVLPRLIAEALRRQTLIRRNRELEERLKVSESVTAMTLAVATLAHEINNPLTTIMGVSELLAKDGALREKGAKRKLKLIQRSASRIRSTLFRLAHIEEPSLRHTAFGPIVDVESDVSVDETDG